jgi:hypothetical protein
MYIDIYEFKQAVVAATESLIGYVYIHIYVYVYMHVYICIHIYIYI